jgi:signal transduction histidine kinase
MRLEAQDDRRHLVTRMHSICDEASILDALGSGVLSIRDDGVIVRANAGAERILRRGQRELVGSAIGRVVAPLEVLEHASFEPVTNRHELTIELGDGTQGSIGFALSCFQASDGRPRYVLQFQDIAPVLELRKQRDRLLAMAALGDALPSVLHELRNPLAAITARLELMVEESEGQVQLDLHAVLTEVRRMSLGLDGVGGFLRSARATGLSAIDLAVQEACRVLEPVAERNGVRLESRGPALPLLPIDRGVMSGIVFNLVKNSIDASKPGGTVRVEARLDRAPDTFVLRVEDDGSGMSPEVIERCTELFYTRKDKGSGIGLALCRRVAESSGGRLEVESELGRGTVVTVHIPVGPPSTVGNGERA